MSPWSNIFATWTLRKYGARICFADDQGCIRAACALARQGEGCPVAHLYDFRSQDFDMRHDGQHGQPAQPLTATEKLKEAEIESLGEKGKLFLCGSCERSLPIDMFTRSQFSKASKVDEDRGVSHQVRRCNECVTQPCCACGQLLSLTAFSGSQMLRPQGSRRCRPCTLDTWWCDRCSKPKPTHEFSSFQARKGKQISKVCQECEKSNPYFDRRHALCAIFSGRYAAPPSRVPAFSKEILMLILSFARESRFITITGAGYSCSLCNKTKSFLGSGGDAVERHLRTSQMHAKRLKSLEAGHLVEVAMTGLDAERFRDGLGLRGAFCGTDQVKEASSLIDIWSVDADMKILVPILKHVGCRESESGQLRWASPEQLEKAFALIEASMHGSVFEGDFFASASMQDVAQAEERALEQKRTKVNMLCHPSMGDSDVEEDEETIALRRFLAR